MRPLAFAVILYCCFIVGAAWKLYQPAPKVVEVERTQYTCAPTYETRIPDVYEFTILGRAQ
jgi:hypothetical protein